MKLTPTQLSKHLAKQLAPIYLVSGDELFLKQDVMLEIRKAAKKAGITERMRLTPGMNFAWHEFYALLYTPSLLQAKRLLEFDFQENLPNQIASDALKTYADTPLPDQVIVIDVNKIDEKIIKSAWYAALEKKSVNIPCWPILRDELPRFIMERASKYKLKIDHDAAHLLAQYVEGNLIAAAQTIEKIYLLNPEKPIDINFIQHFLSDESHYTVFDLIENLIAGEKTRTLNILKHLKSEGTEPTLILWAIARELRLLADLKKHIQQGESYETLFKKYRIYFQRQRAHRYFLNKFSQEDCWHLLMHLAEIDKVMKGITLLDAWESLTLFCLRLFGK